MTRFPCSAHVYAYIKPDMTDHILYIGLNGYAGAGKDTVAKMLKTMLDRDWADREECRAYYRTVYKDPTLPATYDMTDHGMPEGRVYCTAYADQLKNICASIFGIPVERFYMNKSSAWLNVTKRFEYTEDCPDPAHIFTAEQFYTGACDTDQDVWMSLREVLIYIGTYVMQRQVSRDVFVNSVRNRVMHKEATDSLRYVIVTDNRFRHELDFIHENFGITVNITRDSVRQLPNIAEHETDGLEDFDYTLENNGGYGELFDKLWNWVQADPVIRNVTRTLDGRTDARNYIRRVAPGTWMLCMPSGLRSMHQDPDGALTMLDPAGGPEIVVDKPLQTIDPGPRLKVEAIWRDPDTDRYMLDLSGDMSME